jgi:DNA polymerase-1
MSKNRCSFNELEFRRMAEQFDSIFKKRRTATASKPSDDLDSTKKVPTKKAKISLIFWKWNFR